MAKKKVLPELSDSQLEIMDVVWQLEKCTVADVLRHLQQKRSISRNTVHTLMTRLAEKGWLRIVENLESGFVYEATASRESAQQQSLRSIVDTVFQGSAEGLVLTLLDSGEVSDCELERIRKRIAQAKRRKS